ncbi:acyloxyacyl hydrolase [Cupriavidus sp. CV2]|uniref:acyloxyacyl hydrolase n=1 Tax=Cupriavidus ulmosensis TaxID=3065913 RepID=UPI00296B4F2F|nr:acyloxyacyl hydrolase [Cupriavidus sp. CV2]MDW3684343.1 acyloxyacyl hydrolase [Cupriavidus sp. CV2]
MRGSRFASFLGIYCVCTFAQGELPISDAGWFEPTRVGVSLGVAPESSLARIEARWDLRQDLWSSATRSVRLRLGLEASAGAWDPHGGSSGAMGDIGLTPVFRLQGAGPAALFADFGIGAHLLSRTRISNSTVFSSAFQFGDRIAIGYHFDDVVRSELALRLQHFSNGRIKRPNPGINFLLLQYSAQF